jgi:ketosteroid isomerase-like protein
VPSRTSAALLTLLAACATTQEPKPPAPAPERALCYQVLSLRDAALNARDADAAAKAYAVDAVVIDADTNTVVLKGREQIREAHARFLAACPRSRIEATERTYAPETGVVSDVVRSFCARPPAIAGWARYQLAKGAIVGVLKHRVPAFGDPVPPAPADGSTTIEEEER